ncbi:hypothetical protein JIN84_03180 [Luteolibacter yonseiensis]|uniref:Uncharacterized protein n=1 Tax=Luteolibacter yonseiensis TaxID=1144680 RepID=A0A934R3G4_9BACT|nr:hypothetical protein [Luteolibacter yonseiensis]MBK1814600.1 hypothetical protein [Luteolibacter yonseiensis]
MKINLKAVLACFPLSAVLIWSAAAQSSNESSEASQDEPVVSGTSAEIVAEMEQAASEIRTRLHMPALLDVTEDPEREAEIAELYRSGWIIKATVEEVEAAIEAAAATPDLEDDRAAQVLAHRASCRYFLEE